MKKVKIFSLSLLSLFLMFISIVFGGVDASAYSYNPHKDGEDFTPYKDDIVYCDLDYVGPFYEDGGDEVYIYIDDLDGLFQFNKYTDFSPEITSAITDDRQWSHDGFFDLFGDDAFSMWWNPWAQYWQFDYPLSPDFEPVFEGETAFVTNVISNEYSRDFKSYSFD